MPAKSPQVYRAQKLFPAETKTTRKIFVESLGDLTDQFVALLAKLDSDGVGTATYAATLTPQPRVSLITGS
jgi:hypothetical protein